MAATGAIRRKPKGLAAALNTQRVRHLVQLGFVAFIAFIAVQHYLIPEDSGIIVPSAEAFCPFGGLETAYEFIITGGKFVPHAHASSIILFGAIVLSAVFAKSHFCGWVCPFGAIQEWITMGSRWLQRAVPAVGGFVSWTKSRLAFLARLDRPLRYGKYLVLAWAVAGAAAFGVMVFRDYDPWAALLTIAELEIGGGLVVLGITFIASFFVERPWCKYACPLGAFIGVAGKVSPMKIQRESSLCSGCNVCTKQCPMNIPVHAVSRVSAADCNMCLQCVDSCPRAGALELKFSLPGVKVPAPQV